MGNVQKIARSAMFDEDIQAFKVHYWDGTYAEIPYEVAEKEFIIVKDGKTGEEIMREKMAEGWNILIEAKGKGTTYEMTYEGTAYKVGLNLKDSLESKKHAVGDTLWELMMNLFKEGEQSDGTTKENLESN